MERSLLGVMNSRTASKTEEVREEREDSTLAWREWILVMVGEKSIFKSKERLIKSFFVEKACVEKGNNTKITKRKNPKLGMIFFLNCLSGMRI